MSINCFITVYIGYIFLLYFTGHFILTLTACTHLIAKSVFNVHFIRFNVCSHSTTAVSTLVNPRNAVAGPTE